MRQDIEATGLWQDALAVPAALEATLDRREGFAEVAELVRSRGVRRLVVSGNGASQYVAHGLWLAALAGDEAPVEVSAVPAGLLAHGAFHWRDGDLLLAISSSGELRDLVEAVDSHALKGPYVALTAAPESTLGAQATVTALTEVPEQRAVTHTHKFCAAFAAALAIWSEIAGDASIAAAVAETPAACRRALAAAGAWADAELSELQPPGAAAVFASGAAWAAALEGALLLKEVAQLPCEGVETREAATATMTGLVPDHLVVSLAPAGDDLADEAEAICRKLGATTVRLPEEAHHDPRTAAITTFGPVLALSIALALRKRLDPDTPAWTSAYYATARR